MHSSPINHRPIKCRKAYVVVGLGGLTQSGSFSECSPTTLVSNGESMSTAKPMPFPICAPWIPTKALQRIEKLAALVGTGSPPREPVHAQEKQLTTVGCTRIIP